MTFDPGAGWAPYDDSGLPIAARPMWHRREGEATAFGFLAREEHANMRGVVHGGVLATFMDHGLGITVRLATDTMQLATIQLDLHYLAAGQPGQFMEVRGEITRRTRSVVFIRGMMTCAGKPVLGATGIWKLLGS